MANFTFLKPTDYLRDSRAVINTNFANLTAAIGALSGNSALNTRNFGALSAEPYDGKPVDLVYVNGAEINISTINQAFNGNITLSANNGYIRNITGGPGTQLIDDVRENQFGGTWLEFYRVNATSAFPILNGTAYVIKDAPIWPRENNPNEGLVMFGETTNTSLMFNAGPGYNPSVPGIYIPSINNAVSGYKVEIIGPNGVQVKTITLGNAPLYGGNGTIAASANNAIIYPDNAEIGETNQAIILSAFDGLKALGTEITIGTTNQAFNGNITLSANNGYIRNITGGPGTQLIDDLRQNQFGGTWLEFYRTNSTSALPILNGSAYVIKDAPVFPRENNNNESLVMFGQTSNTSIMLNAGPGYNPSVPGVYIPSINNAVSGYKVEIIGPRGLQTKRLLIGDAPLYGGNGTASTSANNLDVFTESYTGIGETGQTVTLSAFDGLKTLGSDIFIGTSNPAWNGNIALSANNGYIKLITGGPGTQLIDDLRQNQFGGTWLEFYRTNSTSALPILNGSAYVIKDAPSWPIDGEANEGLVMFGQSSDTSIAITSGPGYNPSIPGIYIPSIHNASLSGCGVEVIGVNGAQTNKLIIGNKPLYNNNGTLATSANNIVIFPQEYTGLGQTNNSIILSAFDSVKFTGSDIFIGTSNPSWNGNIALSANNGYIQLITGGPGTQLIDDLRQNQFGGTWLEFYRTNSPSAIGIDNGSRYSIKDAPQWPATNQNKSESLIVTGNTSYTSIAITSGPSYDDDTPGMFVPSIAQAASAGKIQLVGPNGTLTRKLTIGNEAIIGDNGVIPATAVNAAFTFNDTTKTVTISALEDYTSLVLKAGKNGRVDIKGGGESIGNESKRFVSFNSHVIEARAENGINPLNLVFNYPYLSGNNIYPVYKFAQDNNIGYNIREFGHLRPLVPAVSSDCGYGRGLQVRAVSGDLHLHAGYSTSATNVCVSPSIDGLFSVLLSSTGAPENISLQVKTTLDNTNIVYLSAGEPTTQLVISPVSAINFADNTKQITAGITVDTITYPPSTSTAPGTTNTFIVSAGTAYLCINTDTWVKWAVDTTW